MKKSYNLCSYMSTAKFGRIVAEMIRHAETYLSADSSEEQKERALMYARWCFEKLEALLKGTSIVVDGVKFAKKHLPLRNDVKFSIKRVEKRVKEVQDE